MEYNLCFKDIKKETPKTSDCGFVSCIVLVNGTNIDYGVYNKYHKLFYAPQYKVYLNGVTHFVEIEQKWCKSKKSKKTQVIYQDKKIKINERF